MNHLKQPAAGVKLALGAIFTMASAVCGCAYDVNLDQKVRVACIGDSNTAPGYGGVCARLTNAYKPADPAQATAYRDWGLLFQTYARAGSTALDTPAGDPEDASGQLNRALLGARPAPDAAMTCQTPETWPIEACEWWSAWDKIAVNEKPDAVVLASGSNDIPSAATPSDIHQRLVQLKSVAEGAGVKALIATVPPRCSCTQAAGAWSCVPHPTLNPKIDALNAQLRADRSLDGKILELNEGFSCSTHFIRENDGVHVNAAGNDLRFERANAIITREIAAAVERIQQRP